MSMRKSEIQNVDLGTSAALSWCDLNETEKSAASLGVHPEHWKPIAFMNDAHYDTLLKANAIDGDLAKKLEVSNHVRLLSPNPLYPTNPLGFVQPTGL